MSAPRLFVVSLHKAGMHLMRRLVEELGYAMAFFDEEDVERAHRDNPASFLSSLPVDAAFFLHDLPIDRFPRPVLEHWRATGIPPLLFHHRDPRAVLLSEVNYLRGEARDGAFSRTSEHLLAADALAACEDESEALDVGMRLLADSLQASYRQSAWMLFHPRVCRTTYEGLVGPRGGGSVAEQEAQVGRVMAHVGVTGNPESVASRLYDPTQRTFHRGVAERWRSVYRPEQLAAFEQLHGALLETYGYRTATPGRHS